MFVSLYITYCYTKSLERKRSMNVAFGATFDLHRNILLNWDNEQTCYAMNENCTFKKWWNLDNHLQNRRKENRLHGNTK
jgi:hypothetical protein